VTQDWVGYAGDVARTELIGALTAAAGAALLVLALRRFGPALVDGRRRSHRRLRVALTYLAPVILEPLFNDFEPLPRGALRSDVLALAERAGVEVGEVYVVDASRRTTAPTHIVAGLGATMRVVLYDTLLRDFEPDEVRLIVAPRAGSRAPPRPAQRLLYVALVAPPGCLAAAALGERFARGAAVSSRDRPPCPPSPGRRARRDAVDHDLQQLSRAVERRADAYSLELTGDRRRSSPCSGGCRPATSPIPRPRAGDFRSRRTHRALERIARPEAAARAATAGARRPAGVARTLELGKALYRLARLPLGEVVLHRLDQLAHERRREVQACHRDARDLGILDLVVDPAGGLMVNS
jgi:hypothetical protein